MFFRKKPSEDELERAILFGAMIARGYELDHQVEVSYRDVIGHLDTAYRKMSIKPDSDQRKMATGCVFSLLEEQTFIDQAIDYRLTSGDPSFPPELRSRMLSIIERSVSEFLNQVKS